jgi:hypothetical protein
VEAELASRLIFSQAILRFAGWRLSLLQGKAALGVLSAKSRGH